MIPVGVGLYPNAPASELVELGVHAESLGYETVWVCDSQLLWREAYVTLGALAASTNRIRLGTAVTNPITRRLTVTASAMCTLGELSGGRAILGIGVGDSALRTEGLVPATVDELAAAIAQLRLLMGGKTANIDAGHEVTIGFAPTTHIPVFIAAAAPRMLKRAGAVADGVILMNGVHADLVGPAIERIHAGATEVDRDPSDIKIVVWAAGAVSDEDPTAARQVVKYNVARAVMRPMPGDRRPDVETVRVAVARHYDYAQHGDPAADVSALIPDELVERYAFAGSSEEVITQLERLGALGVHEAAIAIPRAIGELTPERALDSLAETLSLSGRSA